MLVTAHFSVFYPIFATGRGRQAGYTAYTYGHISFSGLAAVVLAGVPRISIRALAEKT